MPIFTSSSQIKNIQIRNKDVKRFADEVKNSKESIKILELLNEIIKKTLRTNQKKILEVKSNVTEIKKCLL